MLLLKEIPMEHYTQKSIHCLQLQIDEFSQKKVHAGITNYLQFPIMCIRNREARGDVILLHLSDIS